MEFQEYIKAELLVLIPVLYSIGAALKKSEVNDKYIPFILGAIGVLASGVYILSTTPINGTQATTTAIFTAFTQGVLCASASVYANQLYKQSKED